MTTIRWLGLAFLLVAVNDDLLAQGVRGIVVGTDDRLPIHGAFVTLIDSISYQRAAALTDSAGRFFLHAPGPGAFRLRAERIGYETVTSAPLQLTRDTVFIRFEVPTAAVPLDSITVRGDDRNCRKRADATDVYRLWSAINTALRITIYSHESTSMEFHLFRYARETQESRNRLLAEERLFVKQTGGLSFASIAPEELRSGFMRAGTNERILHGPDALLLLSDEFQNTHCFGLVRDRKAGTIGVSFQPMKNVRNIIDIKGVLWVDARSSELRRVTFEYTNLPRDLAMSNAGGQVEFRRLANGHWIVQQWWIRLPIRVARATRRGLLQAYVVGLAEEGGQVLSVDRAASASPGGTAGIEGEVIDSMKFQPVRDALVFVSGQPYQARTDSLGRYRIAGLQPGRYRVAVTTAELMHLGLPMQMNEVDVSSHASVKLDLLTPTAASMFHNFCAGEEPDVGGALIYGVVRDSASAVPLAGAEVRAEWRGPSLRNPSISDRWRKATTGSDGRYYLCWMPQDTELRMGARLQRRDLGTYVVHLHGEQLFRLDFPRSSH